MYVDERCDPDHVWRLPLARLDQPGVDAWRTLHAANAHPTPLTSWEFAHLADDAWGDVEIVLAEHAGRIVFVMPVHLRANRFARPVGGAFADVHGPLVAPGLRLNGAAILRRAGVSAYRFSGLDDPSGVFSGGVVATEPSFAIRLDASTDAYLAARRQEYEKRIVTCRDLEARLVQEGRDLRIVAPDTSDEHFERLLDWKRDQLWRAGHFDFLDAEPNRRLLDLARQADGQAFGGLHLTLLCDGRPVAGHFGVRLGAHYHPWIAASDPDLAEWLPDILMVARAIFAMPTLGLVHYELGTGDARYKRAYANLERPLSSAVVFGGGVGAITERAGEAMGRGFERLPVRPLAHAVRRLRRHADQIATSETRLTRRASALTDAIVNRRLQADVLELVDGE